MPAATSNPSKLRTNGAISLRDFEILCATEPEAYVVDGIIPVASVNIAAGDSGVGKSPWAYQLGLCVASGLPFLGHAVTQGRVLYVDLENGSEGILWLCRSLARHLGISELPKDLYLLRERDSSLANVHSVISQYRPRLVIVDSLRAYQPGAETKNETAATLLNTLRAWAKLYNAAFLIIHHTKKPGEDGPPSLEDTPTMTWLLQASGARALINQSDVRIAFDVTAGLQRSVQRGNAEYRSAKKGTHLEDEAVGLVVKWFTRLRGEQGPVYLGRSFNDEGEPLGYRRLTGFDLLFNPYQQAAFPRLPGEFSFKIAKQIYDRGDQASHDFLQKCIRVGILTHVGRMYKKVE